MASKMDWKKYVSESGGHAIFLPEGFKQAADEMEVKRKEYNKKAIQMAKEEILMNIANQNLFVELRKYLEKNGYPDVWGKELGFNADALNEGVFVLTVRDQMR